jgi:asparagine synthase (glutamine-hydrolysing)
MCGIAGVIDLKKRPQLEALNRMLLSMTHRGRMPKAFIIQSVMLGHRRLSIIDLSTNANQPFFDTNNRYVIVFNGEIYTTRK